jgi:ABC-2 type transport system permease protein
MNALKDGMVLTGRQIRQLTRVPELLVFATIQPVMFVLLFAFVFGGAINVPGGNYREYLMAGIFAQTVAFTVGATSVGVAEDMSKGLIDRFRSMPIARISVLFGRTFGDASRNVLVISVMAICGLLVGWRANRGIWLALAGFAILLVFGFAMSWIGCLIGLSVPNTEVANTVGFIWLFPLTFLSNAFVPTTSMPKYLQAVAEWNPISTIVASLRSLFGNPNPTGITADGLPGQHPVALSIFYIALVLAIFIPLSVRKFRSVSR